jgi:hypothetical protein
MTIKSFFLAAVTFGCFAAPAADYSRVPSTNEVLAALRTGHPRLLVTSTDFVAVQKLVATEPRFKDWHAKVTADADRILSQPPSQYEIPDGLRLLSTSRRVLHRVRTLAYLYRVGGDQKYVDRARSELETAAGFRDWNPKHFLDTAEMTHAFALGYDWLFDVFTEQQRGKLRDAIVEKGLKPALGVYHDKGGWPQSRHNWNQVCNGGIGMGALAIAETDPALAATILIYAVESLPSAMNEFAPDGAWAEGPGYWNYATAYNVVFLAALDTALGTDFGLSRAPAFDHTGLFPIYLTGPIERTFNYADGGDGAIRAPHLYWLARKFRRPEYAAYQDHYANGDAMDIIWRSQLGTMNTAQPALPLDKHFAGADVITLRGAWNDRDASFVGFKGGDNKANHSHLDLGSFVFDALGLRWAVDMGADDYNLPGYFGPKRWDYSRLRGEGQNAVVINPGAGPDQDPKAAAKFIRFGSTPQRGFALVDLSAAYHGHARRLLRGCALINREALLMQDEIRVEQPVDAWWFMHTGAEVQLADDGQSAILSQSGKQLFATLLSPASASFQVMPAQPSLVAPAWEASDEREVRKLAVHLRDTRDDTIAVLLSPKASSAKVEQSKVRALSVW